MDPEKRPIEEAGSYPQKRLKLSELMVQARGIVKESHGPFQFISSGESKPKVDSDNKEEFQPEVMKEEPGHSFIADKDSQIAGGNSTQIIQEKSPEAVGDIPTEDDKKLPSRCPACRKVDHGYDNCPAREIFRKMMFPLCTICMTRTEHDTSDCPKATEDLLKKLSYCRICAKNTDHRTFNCKKENGFTVYNGITVPNVCSLWRKFGHMSQQCPLDSDDLDCDPPSDVDGW